MNHRKLAALLLCGAMMISNLGTVVYAGAESMEVVQEETESPEEELTVEEAAVPEMGTDFAETETEEIEIEEIETEAPVLAEEESETEGEESSAVYYFCSKEASHKKVENVRYIDKNTKVLENGFYVAEGEVTSERTSESEPEAIQVIGDVSIILMDGCNFTSLSLKLIDSESRLTIYGETPESTGQMTVLNTNAEGDAVLGGSKGERAGDIIIDGGNITVYGTSTGASIGGGENGMAGQIIFWGGTTHVYNSTLGAAIGSGYRATGRIDSDLGSIISGKVYVKDGTVTTTTESIPGGEESQARLDAGVGIGSGNLAGEPCYVEISGGTVTAYGGRNSGGIGSCDNSNTGTVVIKGGKVSAYGGANAPGVWANMLEVRGGSLTAQGGETDGIPDDGGRVHSGSGVLSTTVLVMENGDVEAIGCDLEASEGNGARYYAGDGIRASFLWLADEGEVRATGGDAGEGEENHSGYGIHASVNVVGGYMKAWGGGSACALSSDPEIDESYYHVTFGSKEEESEKVVEMTGYPIKGSWSDYNCLEIESFGTSLFADLFQDVSTFWLTLEEYSAADIIIDVDIMLSDEIPEDLSDEARENLLDYIGTLDITSPQDGIVHIVNIERNGNHYKVTVLGLEAGFSVSLGISAGDGSETSVTVNVIEKPEPTPTPSPAPKPSAKEKATGQLQSDLRVKWSDGKMAVSWGEVEGADGYDVFAEKCGNTMNSKDLVKSVKKSKTSVTIAKLAGKKFSSTANYKVKVKAYKLVNNKKKYVASSYVMHIVGGKHKKYTNAKKVTVTKTSYSLAVGGTAKISAKITLNDKSKKALPKKHVKELRYWSTNSKVASVNASGKITAKAQGSCYVYVAAADGAKKKIKVTVK